MTTLRFLFTNLAQGAMTRSQDTINNGAWNTRPPPNIANDNHGDALATFNGPDSSATVVYKPDPTHLLTVAVTMRDGAAPVATATASPGYRVTCAVALQGPGSYLVSVTFYRN